MILLYIQFGNRTMSRCHIYAAKSVQVGGSLASIQELKNDNKSRDGPQGGPLKGNDRVMKKIADTESN